MKCTKMIPKGEGTYFLATFVYKGRPRSRDFLIEESKYMVLNPKEGLYQEATYLPWKELKDCRFIVV